MGTGSVPPVQRTKAAVAIVWTVPIVPDTKDWTWVLRAPCPECGLDTRSLDLEAIPAMIRANAGQWHDLLTDGGDHHERPEPAKWSALEYGCHVRDVLRIYDTRLTLMLAVDGPHYPNWDQDATAVEDRYADQDPPYVATEIVSAADFIAARFARVTADEWQRTGYRSDGAAFTVETFARYFIHDPVHHLYDVTGVRWAAV
jgi:hypothetical protein